VRTRWTWLGGVAVDAIEIVQDGDGIEVNILPASPITCPPGDASPGAEAPLPADPVVERPADIVTGDAQSPQDALAAPLATGAPSYGARGDYSAGQRVKMGVVRGTWVQVFGLAGTGIVYAANNAAGLGLPTYGVFLVGLGSAGVGYAVKRGLLPDGTI